jgi:hypothetical protein
MKTITYTLLAVIVLFTAATLPAAAQSEESRKVSGFRGVASEVPYDVQVKIGGTEGVKISASSDIIALIETVVVDGTLKIRFKRELKSGEGNSNGKVIIYVSVKSLSSIVKAGAGYVTVEGTATGSDIDINLNGSGSIKSAVKSKKLQVNINGPGTVNLSGTADEAKVTISGPGNLSGRDLKTNNASATINGAGNICFGVKKTVSATIVGAGSVVYSGNAIVTSRKVVGSGGISKAK